jgi:hypothetical protein
MLLERDDWYGIAHDLDWSLSYVEHEAAFPAVWSGSENIPQEAWRAWSLPEAARLNRRDLAPSHGGDLHGRTDGGDDARTICKVCAQPAMAQHIGVRNA